MTICPYLWTIRQHAWFSIVRPGGCFSFSVNRRWNTTGMISQKQLRNERMINQQIIKCGGWIYSTLFLPYCEIRGGNQKKKSWRKKKRLHVIHAPILPAKYCFTSHVSACQNEVRGISASTHHISPHTHTLVQFKMKDQHKKETHSSLYNH